MIPRVKTTPRVELKRTQLEEKKLSVKKLTECDCLLDDIWYFA
jgi:hypothetical protein